MQKQIRIKQVETLSDDWYVLKKTTFEFQRRDGSWQTVSRETYDRGNGATILLYNPLKKTVILTRQFRFPAFVNQHSGVLIETCAGLLDQDDPLTSIQREAAEETGRSAKPSWPSPRNRLSSQATFKGLAQAGPLSFLNSP